MQNFKNILEENLKNTGIEDYPSKSQTDMFNNLITVAYFFKDQDPYSFLSDIFDYSILLNETNYFNILEEVKERYEYYFPDKIFKDDIFMKYYLNLIHYSFSGQNIENALKFLKKNYKEDKGTFKGVMQEMLSIIAGTGENEYPRFSDYITKNAEKILNEDK